MSNGFGLVPRALLLLFSQFVSGKVEMQDSHIKNQSVRAFELEEEHRVSRGLLSRTCECPHEGAPLFEVFLAVINAACNGEA